MLKIAEGKLRVSISYLSEMRTVSMFYNSSLFYSSNFYNLVLPFFVLEIFKFKYNTFFLRNSAGISKFDWLEHIYYILNPSFFIYLYSFNLIYFFKIIFLVLYFVHLLYYFWPLIRGIILNIVSDVWYSSTCSVVSFFWLHMGHFMSSSSME